jgi:hypothetical protein
MQYLQGLLRIVLLLLFLSKAALLKSMTLMLKPLKTQIWLTRSDIF